MTTNSIPPKLDAASYKKLVSRASLVAMLTACSLIAIKFFVVVISNSIALYASLMDSVFDLLCSFLNFMVLRQALKPADDDHTFGHGKFEYFGIIAQSVFIATSSLFLLLNSVNRFKYPVPIENTSWSIIIMVVSVILTFGLVTYQSYVIRQTNSEMIKVDQAHYKMDLLMNTTVALAILISHYGYTFVDNVLAIVIAIYMLYSVLGMLKTAYRGLTDVTLPEADIQVIHNIARLHPRVLGIHDLRTRQASNTKYIQFHLEIEDNATLREAHDICDEIETAIQEAFRDTLLIIHPEPKSVVDQERQGSYKAKVNQELMESLQNLDTPNSK